jgi:hypothetical protein
MFARWAYFCAPCVLLLQTHLKLEATFCWKLCNVDFSPQTYPNPGESKSVMPNDFEMIKLVRENLVAQAILF